MGGGIKTRDMRNPRYRDEVAQTEGVISVWATWLRTDKGSGQREERTPGKRSQGRDGREQSMAAAGHQRRLHEGHGREFLALSAA